MATHEKEGVDDDDDSEAGTNRYAFLVGPAELDEWRRTFDLFDVDHGGDVSCFELGLMFRQLGSTPTESEVQFMVDTVDVDGSGTIDFEEFTLLMLRQKRLALAPVWLVELLHQSIDAENEPAALPSHAGLARNEPESPSGVDGSEGHGLESRDLLHTAIDLLPGARHITSCSMGGYGPLFGPFLAEELAQVET